MKGRSPSDRAALASVGKLADRLGRRRSGPNPSADRRASSHLYDALHALARQVDEYDRQRAAGTAVELRFEGGALRVVPSAAGGAR